MRFVRPLLAAPVILSLLTGCGARSDLPAPGTSWYHWSKSALPVVVGVSGLPA